MRFTILLLALVSAISLAATNAAAAPRPVASQKPQTAASLKPQATTLGTESITIPQMLSYQGKLTDTLGAPVPDTTYQVTFRLYTVATGGASFWNETQTVRTRNGLFSTLVGSVAPIESVPSSGSLYLGMAVAGGAELSPRLQLVGSAYSYLAGKSANSDLLQGKDTTGFVRTGQASSVTSAMIVANTIVRSNVATNFKAPYTDTADYAKAAPASDSARVAGNSHLLQGKDTTALWNAKTLQGKDTTGFVQTGQANSITGTMIVDGTISSADLGDTTVGTAKLKPASVTAPKLNQMGASTGQVLKWTGSAWAPRNDSVGGGTVASVRQATGIVCSPNPITDSGTVRLDTTYSDGRYIKNQNSSGQTANFYITGTGQAGLLYGKSTSASYGAIVGDGGTYACGVYGNSTGVYGVFGTSTDSAGVYGTSTNKYGVYGTSTNGKAGVYGTSTDSTGYHLGVYGVVGSSSGYGSGGFNTNASGTGVAGIGNNTSGSRLDDGSGVAGTGTEFGVYGRASDTGSGSAAGYFENGHGGYVNIAYYYNGTEYKINGSGTVSTIMATREGKKNLFAPEMPEAYFEDCGDGQLANGHCRVNLEKLFSDCVTVNAEHPLKVFVQVEDDCKGVYVNKDATGFDVHELQGGTSNAHFSWRVLAKWKGNENLRLPDAPGPQPTTTGEKQVTVEGKTTTATPPKPVEVKSATSTQPRPVPGLK